MLQFAQIYHDGISYYLKLMKWINFSAEKPNVVSNFTIPDLNISPRSLESRQKLHFVTSLQTQNRLNNFQGLILAMEFEQNFQIGLKFQLPLLI